MTKTNKIKSNKHLKNRTKRNETSLKRAMANCPIGLKPFEETFSRNIPKRQLRISNSRKKKEFVKELNTKFAPNSIKPNDDFYDFINYTWLKNVSVEKQQKYIVQVDDFRLAQDKVYTQLHEIIMDYCKTHNDQLSRNLMNYYKSIINMNPKPYTRQLAKEAVVIIDDYTSGEDPWKLLAYINSDEMIAHAAPFVWSLAPDEKNSKIFRCYISPHQFTLADLEIYYDDGTNVSYKKKYRKEYAKYVNKVFNVLLGPNHNYNPNDVFDVEVEMFDTLGCSTITTGEESAYNKVYTEEALTKYGFNWKEFSKNIGFREAPHFFISTSLNYLKCGSDLFIKNWNSPKWKTYWVFILLRRLARITRDWEKIPYDFHGKFERGQEEINRSDAVSSSLYMSVPFNTFLTNEYVKKYENQQAIDYVKILCTDLKEVFKRMLTRNTWMAPSTKKYALKKLKHFNFVYGKPEDLREDPDLEYGTILYDNMRKINLWRLKKFIELEGKNVIDIPMMDWTQYPVKMTGTQAYIVNASYTPAKNSIYINLGYIQKPFVDLDERGIEYNLAHIGFTISHEMGHGFDDMGSKYGWDGNLYDWWTPHDKKKFKEIQNDVIKQYEEFASRDGIKFDASIGIGEDLADISSMAVCTEYLRDFQEKNQDLVPIRSLSFEAFYIYFAFQQRQFVSKKAIAAQLKTNPHPLDKYRCNIPLSRIEIFRGLYNVHKGDGMWWHNTNTIW
jgi:putative endopeptidase